MVTTIIKRDCFYCGKPTGRGWKGEHVVPDALGCDLTLNDVCERGVERPLHKVGRSPKEQERVQEPRDTPRLETLGTLSGSADKIVVLLP